MAKRNVAVDDRPLFIIGVDPGKITGVSIYTNWKLIHHNEIPADEVYEMLALHTLPALHGLRVIIAAERYVFGVNSTRKTRQSDPMKLTGQLEGIAKLHDAEFRLVNQADSKKMAPDSKLRELGWYTKTKDGHANDASRVVFVTLAHVHPTEFTKLVYGVIE